MGKASNQGDGVIACTGASLLATGALSVCGVAACGLDMPGSERGLAEALCLLRLLMAPSGHPHRIREASPELRIALLGEAAPGIFHQLGLSQPRNLHASLAPKLLWKSLSPEGGL